MSEARNFKFGTLVDLDKSHLMHDKIPLKGAWSGSRGQFFNCNPFHKFGMGEARNVKFGIRIDLGMSPNGVWSGSGAIFLTF